MADQTPALHVIVSALSHSLTHVRGWGLIGLQLQGDSIPLASTGICTHTHVLVHVHIHTHYNEINNIKSNEQCTTT